MHVYKVAVYVFPPSFVAAIHNLTWLREASEPTCKRGEAQGSMLKKKRQDAQSANMAGARERLRRCQIWDNKGLPSLELLP